MKRRPASLLLVLIGGLLGLAATIGGAEADVFEAAGPTRKVEIGSIVVSIPTRIALTAERGSTGPAQIRVTADLADLQTKMAALIATVPLPRENCAKYAADNLVASISEAALTSSGNDAVITLGGEIVVWACLENPVPKTRIEMRMKKIGPIKTKVPVVTTSPGDPIKTKLASQPVKTTLPVSLAVEAGQTVRLVPGQPDVELGGQYVAITNGILSIANIDINKLAADALEKAIDPAMLSSTLPPALQRFAPVMKTARFKDVGGHLVAEIEGEATISFADILGLPAELGFKGP